MMPLHAYKRGVDGIFVNENENKNKISSEKSQSANIDHRHAAELAA